MVRSNFRKTIGIWIFVIICFIVLGYGYFEARNIINGPQISIKNPQNGMTLDNPLVTIMGSARNVAFISLNDRQIYVDDKGYFDEPILLSPGYNMIRLNVKDKFGRSRQNILELVYKKT